MKRNSILQHLVKLDSIYFSIFWHVNRAFKLKFVSRKFSRARCALSYPATRSIKHYFFFLLFFISIYRIYTYTSPYCNNVFIRTLWIEIVFQVACNMIFMIRCNWHIIRSQRTSLEIDWNRLSFILENLSYILRNFADAAWFVDRV